MDATNEQKKIFIGMVDLLMEHSGLSRDEATDQILIMMEDLAEAMYPKAKPFCPASRALLESRYERQPHDPGRGIRPHWQAG